MIRFEDGIRPMTENGMRPMTDKLNRG